MASNASVGSPHDFLDVNDRSAISWMIESYLESSWVKQLTFCLSWITADMDVQTNRQSFAYDAMHYYNSCDMAKRQQAVRMVRIFESMHTGDKASGVHTGEFHDDEFETTVFRLGAWKYAPTGNVCLALFKSFFPKAFTTLDSQERHDLDNGITATMTMIDQTMTKIQQQQKDSVAKIDGVISKLGQCLEGDLKKVLAPVRSEDDNAEGSNNTIPEFIRSRIDEINKSIGDIHKSIGDVQKSVSNVNDSVSDIPKSIGEVEKSIGDVHKSVSTVSESVGNVTSSLNRVKSLMTEATGSINKDVNIIQETLGIHLVDRFAEQLFTPETDEDNSETHRASDNAGQPATPSFTEHETSSTQHARLDLTTAQLLQVAHGRYRLVPTFDVITHAFVLARKYPQDPDMRLLAGLCVKNIDQKVAKDGSLVTNDLDQNPHTIDGILLAVRCHFGKVERFDIITQGLSAAKNYPQDPDVQLLATLCTKEMEKKGARSERRQATRFQGRYAGFNYEGHGIPRPQAYGGIGYPAQGGLGPQYHANSSHRDKRPRYY